MTRATLHLAILLVALFSTESFSTWAYVLPTACVCFFAAIQNKSENFDFLDMFWLLFAFSFVAAPVALLTEPSNSILFSQGVIVPYGNGTSLLYRQDQAVLLYFILFIVAVINAVLLPRTYRLYNQKNITIKTGVMPLALLLLVSFVIQVIMTGGIANVLAPRYFKEANAGGLFTQFAAGSTVALAIILAVQIRYETSATRYVALALLIFILAILYNPFNASRFRIIQTYLPISVILIPSIIKFRNMSFMIILGLVIVMPILSLTTRFGLDADLSDLTFDATDFLGFLDQHKVMLHLIEMVQRDGLQLGASTLSVVFFFVPRVLWEAKPIVIALAVGGELYNDGFVGTDNLSGPIIADFYYDFGLVGVIVGTICVAYLMRRVLQKGHLLNGVPIPALLLLGALPILFRGSVGAVAGNILFIALFYYFYVFAMTRLSLCRRNSMSKQTNPRDMSI